MNLPIPDVSNMDPSKFIMWLAAALIVFVLGFIGTQVYATRDEHQQLYSQVQILCVHQASDKDERKECLIGKLTQKTLDSLH
jgi:hypothetical protein